MFLQSLTAFFAFGPAPGGQQSPAPFWVQLFPLFLLFVLMYFLLIRPQQKKARDHQNLMKTLKRGDRIITGSGIVGTIVAVKDKTISLRTEDTKIEVLKSAVTEITERESQSSQANP